MNYEWMGVLWILVPLVAIVGGIVYAIVKLRYGTNDEQSGIGAATTQETLQLMREGITAQRDVAEQLRLIEGRLGAMEKTLNEVP